MICEKIYLNEEHTAYLETYILEKEISYKVDKKWPAVIICPGGGYIMLATKEGEGTAMQFLNKGYSCFVLKYSTYLYDRESLTSGHPNINENAHYPTQELQLMEAMHIIKSRAEEWSIDKENIFTLGFSAGGHISGSLATRWNDKELTDQLSFVPDGEELKPRGSILAYPMLNGNLSEVMNNANNQEVDGFCQNDFVRECLFGHNSPTDEEIRKLDLSSYVSKDTAPIFLWHTTQDVITDSIDSTRFIEQMQKSNVPCEYHLFTKGPHGLACCNEHYAKNDGQIDSDIELWLPLAFNWMKYIMNTYKMINNRKYLIV